MLNNKIDMKKIFYFLSACTVLLCASACSSGNKPADGTSDSDTTVLVTPDSSAIAEETTQVEEVNPKEVLTISIEKKDLKYVPESSVKKGVMIVKVTNNSNSLVKGSDYMVAYDEIVEDWVGTEEDGGIEDVTEKRTVAGKDIEPGESVSIELKSTEGCLDIKNPKIKNVR